EGDGAVKVWDSSTGNLLDTLRGHGIGNLRVAVCPKGRYLASAGEDRLLILWDAATRQEVRRLKLPAPAHSLSFSSDGQRLAVACADSSVQIWEMTTGQRPLQLRLPGRPAYQVLFSPDGRRLAAVIAGDATLRIWDATPGP